MPHPRRLLMAAVIALVLVGIGGGFAIARGTSIEGSQGSPAGLVGYTWELSSFIQDGTVLPLLADHPITLTFAAKTNHVSGSDGCNSYGATYSASHGRLHFSRFFETLMACFPAGVMDQASRYTAALSQATTYQLAQVSLTLRDNAGHVLTYYRAT